MMIRKPYDPECKRCGGTGYVDYYTAHLDFSTADVCDCDTVDSKYWSGDEWLKGVEVIPAKFYGALLVKERVNTVVVHCGHSESTGFGKYFQNPIERDDDGYERWRVVSAHCAVLDSGVQQYVPLTRIAWHAQGNNLSSLGVELQGPPTREWPTGIIDELAGLIRTFCLYYPIEVVCSHRSLAPLRRKDPGKNFPWALLGSQLQGLVMRP